MEKNKQTFSVSEAEKIENRSFFAALAALLCLLFAINFLFIGGPGDGGSGLGGTGRMGGEGGMGGTGMSPGPNLGPVNLGSVDDESKDSNGYAETGEPSLSGFRNEIMASLEAADTQNNADMPSAGYLPYPSELIRQEYLGSAPLVFINEIQLTPDESKQTGELVALIDLIPHDDTLLQDISEPQLTENIVNEIPAISNASGLEQSEITLTMKSVIDEDNKAFATAQIQSASQVIDSLMLAENQALENILTDQTVANNDARSERSRINLPVRPERPDRVNIPSRINTVDRVNIPTPPVRPMRTISTLRH